MLKRIKEILRGSVTLCLASIALSLMAVPARQGVLTFTQPDGTELEYRLIGDENCHSRFTIDGHLLVACGDRMCYAQFGSDGSVLSTGILAHNASARTASEKEFLVSLPEVTFNDVVKHLPMKPKKLLNIDNFPTKGELHGLILLVNFQNAKMTDDHGVATYTRVMNEPDMSDFNCTGSARDYFIDQSDGAFLPTFDVYGVIELDEPYATYGQNDWNGNDVNAYQMVVEACNKAHEQFGVDFSNYDSDNDGYVDFVYIFYAGYAESNGASYNTIWPHASNLTSSYIDLKIDGKQIDRYACSSELDGVSGTQLSGIGTFCHEFSHVLGLPDLYNVADQYSIQLGMWDLMDQGSYLNNGHTPPSLSAWERYSLRWLDLVELDEPQRDVELPELTANNFGYIIRTHNENEFFVLENRQRRGWDYYLPGTGMLVFHIDFYREQWENNRVNCYNLPLVDLIEADATQTGSEASDLFPGPRNVMMLTDFTYPNMILHDGEPADRGLTKITERGDGVITFDFRHDKLKTPVIEGPVDVTDTSFGITWAPVRDALSYKAYLTEVYPDSEKIEVFHEDFSFAKEGNNPDADYDDISKVMDALTPDEGWSGNEIYQAGGWVRVGSYGNDGLIRTPALEAEGPVSIVISGCAYVGKKVNFAIELYDWEKDEVYASQEFTCKRPTQTFKAFFDDFRPGTKVQLRTVGERLYVDELRVVKGEVAEGEEWSLGQVNFEFEDISVH